MEELYIGLMSGTSVDSVDSVLVNLANQRVRILAKISTTIPKDLKIQTLKATSSDNLSIQTIESLDNQFGILFAKAASNLLDINSINKSNIKAIGSHGQTIKHSPYPPRPYSLQVGSPEKIVQLTGIKTVADFRSADIEASGEGAPLTPLFHQFVFKCNNLDKGIVINIGGICNLTFINNKKNEIFGYDCGPGNCLLDTWARFHGKGDYDYAGKWASSGNIIPDLLKIMASDPFFSLNHPKSTGPDYFNLAWLKKKVDLLNQIPSGKDVQATLSELTAQIIFQELKKFESLNEKVYVCGGGIHNNFLAQNIQKKIRGKTLSTESLGVDPDYLEAICFAWLAQQRLKNVEFNLAKITGSKKLLCLGEVWDVSDRTSK